MAGETGGEIYQTMWSNATNGSGANWGVISSTNIVTPHVDIAITMASNQNREIHPALFFKYLKSKLNAIEMHLMKERLAALEKATDEFAELGQEALSDEMIRRYVKLSREAAIYACGYKFFIKPEHVEKFKYRLKGCSLKITPLKNFARIMPEPVVKKLKDCMKKKLFDDYVIFHLDNRAVKETEKERIERKRDPILFGKLNDSDNYYFIADWIDEIDDLTLKVFLGKIGVSKKELGIARKIKLEDVFGDNKE